MNERDRERQRDIKRQRKRDRDSTNTIDKKVIPKTISIQKFENKW